MARVGASENGELTHLNHVRVSHLIRDSDQNVFAVDGKTCKVTGIIKYNHPTIPSRVFLNATPDTLTKNKILAEYYRSIIRSVYTTGLSQTIAIPTLPEPGNNEPVQKKVHFKKNNDNKTVLAILGEVFDYV